MYGVKDMPVEMSNLREVRESGYEVMDVIRQVNAMMKEYKALEEALELKSWGKPYTKPEEYKKLRLRAARLRGYVAEDVKKLYAQLDEKIVYMRAKLDVERDKKNWNQEWQEEGK
ncbi:MAG: hypothetical protein IJ737_00470 [Ruminococcus sp.]|nr:hypothetical protein [Ruminococcus sp.]